MLKILNLAMLTIMVGGGWGWCMYFIGIQEWPGSKPLDGQDQAFQTKYTK